MTCDFNNIHIIWPSLCECENTFSNYLFVCTRPDAPHALAGILNESFCFFFCFFFPLLLVGRAGKYGNAENDNHAGNIFGQTFTLVHLSHLVVTAIRIA